METITVQQPSPTTNTENTKEINEALSIIIIFLVLCVSWAGMLFINWWKCTQQGKDFRNKK